MTSNRQLVEVANKESEGSKLSDVSGAQMDGIS